MTEEKILYADPWCVVANKRAGEAVEGAREGMVDLGQEIRKVLGVCPYLEAAHRLDVPVSGCVVYARSPQAAAALGSAFAEGQVRKVYWAVVEKRPDGVQPKPSAEVVHYLYFDHRTNLSRAYPEAGKNRKRAVLRYRLLGEGERYHFLEVLLVTGRHHQIRAQLAALSFPVKGDLKYGARRSEREGGIRLHCRSLSFPHPAGGGRGAIEVIAPPPGEDALWAAVEAAALISGTNPTNS